VPGLGVYDRVVVQKAFFTWRDVREGDIVVFGHPRLDDCLGPKGDLVKRVIALPGQTIYSSSIVGKVVLVFWHDDHPDFRRF
jgi:signal peptidase I